MLQAEFDRATGRFTFADPDLTGTRIESATAWARYRLANGDLRNSPLTGLAASIREEPISDAHGMGMQWTCHSPANPDGIELTYDIKNYAHRPFLLFRLGLQNHRREPITLQNLCLFQANPSNAGMVKLDSPVEDYRFFKVGWHGWDYTGLCFPTHRNQRHWLDGLTSLSYSNPATRKPHGQGEFVSEGWGIYSGRDTAIVAGFTSTARQFGQVYASLRPRHAALMLLTQLDGIRLDPGEMCVSEWGYLQFVRLLHPQPDTEYVEAVARQMQARVPATAPAAMWTHWYQFYHRIDERTFLQNVDQLADHHNNVPFKLVELDDGYQSAWGDWTTTNEKFQHGLGWLASEVRKRGFTPGLWLAPFAVQARSRLAHQHPDWLVKDHKGKLARVGFQYNFTTYALDLSHPQVLDHLRMLAHTLTHALGFGMLKLDFINAAALPGQRYDPKQTRAEILRHGLEALRQGAGDDTFLLGCGCPFGPAIGLVDAMRIGPDTAPSWKPYFNWIPWAGPLLKGNPSMPSLRNALRTSLTLSSLHRKWWWNDPDCLLVRDQDTRLTEPEVQSAVSLVGLSSGMLVSSDNLRNVSELHMSWLSLLVPNLGLMGEVLDLLQRERPSLYRVAIEHAGMKWQLVAVFNWSDHPADYRLMFAALGYPPGASLHVYDFWSQQYHRVSETEMVFTHIPAHGCKLLRVCEAGPVPQLVGDTLHISQGMELSAMRIVDNRLVVETVDLGRQAKGQLLFSLPGSPREARGNGTPVEVVEKGAGIYTVDMEFTGKASTEIFWP